MQNLHKLVTALTFAYSKVQVGLTIAMQIARSYIPADHPSTSSCPPHLLSRIRRTLGPWDITTYRYSSTRSRDHHMMNKGIIVSMYLRLSQHCYGSIQRGRIFRYTCNTILNSQTHAQTATLIIDRLSSPFTTCWQATCPLSHHLSP